MQNITSILKAISPVKFAVSPNGKQATRTSAQFEEALAAIDAERAVAQKALGKVTDLRCDLLLKDGTDSEIAAAEAETDRLHLILERLDAAEPTICAQLRCLSEAAADTAIDGLIIDYRERLARFLSAMRDAIAIYIELTQMRRRLDESGFAARIDFPVPNSPFPLSIDDLENFCRTASEQVDIRRERKQIMPVYQVTFLRSVDGYNLGETAGFGANPAWSFVRGGSAEWADRRNIPPVPAQRHLMATAKANGGR